MKNFFAIGLALSLPFSVSVAAASAENASKGLLERSRQKSAGAGGAENSSGNAAVSATESLSGRHAEKSFFRGLQMLMPVSGFVDYRLPADISGKAGKLSAVSAGAAVAARYVGEETTVYGSFDYRFTHYYFKDTVETPFRDMNALRWYLRGEQQVSGPWGVFFDGTLRLAADADTELDEGLTGRAGGGVKFLWSRNLSFYAGAQAFTRLERDPMILPFFGLDWRISRRWSVQCSNGINVVYDVWGDGTLRLDLGCAFSPTDYRVVPGDAGKRALEIREVPLTFSATQELWRRGYVRAAITGVLWSNYKFRADDESLGDFDVNPALSFSLEAGIRF